LSSAVPARPPFPQGASAALATRHGKERALERPFLHALGLPLVLAEVDTDALGTFDGERPRPAPARDTCRLKAEQGMAATGLTRGLASEGSFGPHPRLPLLPVGEEWLVFLDREQDLVVEEHLLAPRTNFSHLRLAPGADPSAWLLRIGHPRHGVLVRPSLPTDGPAIWRDLDHPDDLHQAIQRAAAASADGQALLETDMRAHRNPTRMASIRRLGFRLVRRLARRCPSCGSPGFGERETLPGLPCAWCGTATELVLWEELACTCCGHRERHPRRDGRLRADPGHCPLCNP
jgi:hypothetical protein